MSTQNKLRDNVSTALIVVGWFAWAGGHVAFAESALSLAGWLTLMAAGPLAIYLLARSSLTKDYGHIGNWYHVSFDQSRILIEQVPPAKPMTRAIPWDEVASAKFVTRDVFSSDEIWLYSAGCRKPLIKIPTEAAGGPELVGEIVGRDLLSVEKLLENG